MRAAAGQPTPNAIYEVVRYRTSIADPRERRTAGYDTTEKLQWDVDGRELLRFERRGRRTWKKLRLGCSWEWHELPRGSPEYLRETGVILWLYGLQMRLLEERDRRLRPGRGPLA